MVANVGSKCGFLKVSTAFHDNDNEIKESVTFDSARENDYTFMFAQNQFISFAVYMDEKTDAEYLHVYFGELHSKK